MRRLVQDLGDLTGLDIVVAARCALVRDAAAQPDRAPTGAALALEVLRWLGLAPASGGRCRLDDRSDVDGAPSPRLH